MGGGGVRVCPVKARGPWRGVGAPTVFYSQGLRGIKYFLEVAHALCKLFGSQGSLTRKPAWCVCFPVGV